MNKKYMYGLLGLFAIGLVAAGVGYYALATYTLTINQPISVTGAGAQSVPSCNTGDTCLSDNPITITNTDDEDKSVFITDDSDTNVAVSYVGKMTFAEKDLYTGDVSTTNIAEVIYSVTGESFTATGIPTTHKLIYYPDMGEFTTNVANILVYGVNTFPSLPVSVDIGDDYCNIMTGDDNVKANPNATACNGAKLWLVENGYIDTLILGTWTPSMIMFETDLTTYTVSSTGEILVPALSTITVYPAFTPDQHASGGSNTIDVTVA